MNITKITSNLLNIKLVFRVQSFSCSQSVVTDISNQFLTLIKTIPENSRIRLYSYFIYDTIGSRGGSKPKQGSEKVAEQDATTLNFLGPILQTFTKDLLRTISEHQLAVPTEQKTPSLLRYLLTFNNFISRKLATSTAFPPKTKTSLLLDYNVILQDICFQVEQNSTCIIMPTFDPKVINSKHLPKDLLNNKDIHHFLYFHTSEDDLRKLLKPSKPLEKPAEHVLDTAQESARRMKALDTLLNSKLNDKSTHTNND